MIIYSVSEITQKIKHLVSSIGWIWVKGEVSNLNYHSSGHIYFSLKDEDSVLRAVIFRSTAQNLEYRLKEGQEFQVYGRIDIWRMGSQYQLVAEAIIPGKIGTFYLRFKEIQERLEKKGLFDKKHKKELPGFPQRIGIITSAEGAALRDVLKMLKKRSPPIDVIIRPTLVQGKEASSDIISAIREFNEYKNVDLLILTRGGGSIEDLWCFNDEKVANAIFESDIPIISAIGHERDGSISDFVADMRAATPTEAGEIAVPSRQKLLDHLTYLSNELKKTISNRITFYKTRLESFERSYALKRPLSLIEIKQQNIDHFQDMLIQYSMRTIHSLKERINQFIPRPPELSVLQTQINTLEKELKNSANNIIKEKKQVLNNLTSTLQATSIEKTLLRGFSIVRKELEIIKDSKKLSKGDQIQIQFYRGTSKALIEEPEAQESKTQESETHKN